MGELPMDEQANKPQMAAIDLKGMIAAVPAYIDLLQARSHKFREALFFAEEHIKAGKPWDEECEKVIGEALRPKPPNGFYRGGETA